MAKTKEEHEQIRRNLRDKLDRIVDAAYELQIEMNQLSSTSGIVHKILKPKSGQYITSNVANLGIVAQYKDSNGVLYNIQIFKK